MTTSNEDEPAPTARSGVRERARPTDQRVLIVDPDPLRRERLLEQARALELEVRLAASVDEAIAMRAAEPITFVACYFPLAGSAGLMEELYAERFPAAVLTNQVPRAIAMFGLDMPLLPVPCSLAQILEQAEELARATPAPLAQVASPEYAAAAAEIVLAPRRRDPRRE